MSFTTCPLQQHRQPAHAALHPSHRVIFMRPAFCAAALALLLAFAGSAPMRPQNGGVGSIPTQNHLSTKPNDTSMPMKEAIGTDQRILQMRNAARQMDMISDAGKLLQLANQLHAEVAAAHSPTLTPAQVRKVQQIEKLAHKVRTEMAISLGDSEGGIMPIPTIGIH